MAHPTGESELGAIRLDFDRRLMVQFRGSLSSETKCNTPADLISAC